MLYASKITLPISSHKDIETLTAREIVSNKESLIGLPAKTIAIWKNSTFAMETICRTIIKEP